MRELCPQCILTWLEDMFFLTDNGDEGKLDGQGQGKQPLKCCKKPVHPLAGLRTYQRRWPPILPSIPIERSVCLLY